MSREKKSGHPGTERPTSLKPDLRALPQGQKCPARILLEKTCFPPIFSPNQVPGFPSPMERQIPLFKSSVWCAWVEELGLR